MSIYKEIIDWSANKPEFIKDGLRRLLNSPQLSASDFDELLLLLKKEVGYNGISIIAIPATENDIPTNVGVTNDTVKLISLEDPTNINALYSKAKLSFAQDGLTVIYGNNGSGKSSYARLLKKLCWSRHKNIELKKNIFTNDATDQSVKISYNQNGTITPFQWNNNPTPNDALNSIYVFDSNCANIYLNNENPTEYKPVGIDLLEGLTNISNVINSKLDDELRILVKIKPSLDSVRFSTTSIYSWYSNIENELKQTIIEKLQFSDVQKNRKAELIPLLSNNNPIAENSGLQQKVARYNTAHQLFKSIENLFSTESIQNITSLHSNYIAKKQVYILSQQVYNGVNSLSGFGSETWRLMWEAAKTYAITEIHPNSQNFPDEESTLSCVLCQQPLNDDAKSRLEHFNSFVQDLSSTEFLSAETALNDEIEKIINSTVVQSDTLEELKLDIIGFNDKLETFDSELATLKQEIQLFVQNQESSQLIPSLKLTPISDKIHTKIVEIQTKITGNIQLSSNRVTLEKELLELQGLEILTNSSAQILEYHEESNNKYWLNQCKSKINKRAISLKIGELMESKAIELQQAEFLNHLESLNPKIAEKVSIKKTRTTDGETYQKCVFNGIAENISSVLSEGEQKIIALANFLSECTIDGATNSLIFDDPVTSLDLDYREAIGNKITELSANRQVIVLTHDLYFVRFLMDSYKLANNTDCNLYGLKEFRGESGIVSDEIPYLAKNVQQRIDTIQKDLVLINSYQAHQIEKIEETLERLRQRMRKLTEKTVEEILANNSIQRFSKNIKMKKLDLLNFVITEQTDIEFLLSLFGKYSITEHDGSIQVIPIQPDETAIALDLNNFSDWKNNFNERVKAFKLANSY